MSTDDDSRKKEIERELPSRYLENSRLGNNPEKKANEMEICLAFLERLGVERKNIAMVASETPDFIVTVERSKIGLEVTSFYSDIGRNGSPGNALFQVWRDIAERLRATLSNQGLKKWFGAVHFKDTFDLLKADRDRLIHDLAELAKVSLRGSTVGQLQIEPGANTFLASAIDHIWCEDIAPAEDVLWWHAGLQSGVISGDVKQILADISAAKDETFAKRNTKLEGDLSEIWLLIFGRGAHLWDWGQLVDPGQHRHQQDKQLASDGGALASMKMNALNRIFFWDKKFEAIWEIYPNRQVLFHRDNEGFVLRTTKVPPALRARSVT